MGTETTRVKTRSLSAGRALLRDPNLNKGTAFTAEERASLGLQGLLPAAVLSLEEQGKRSYEQYSAQPTDVAKNDFLAALHDRNEVLYYKLLEDHLSEMLPVVYDPLVAQAIERYSHEFQRPNGVYLSVDDIDGLETAFSNYGLGAEDVDLLVATDASWPSTRPPRGSTRAVQQRFAVGPDVQHHRDHAEQILGIGDWGANGMAISVGTTLREAALALGVAASDFDRIVDPKSMVGDPRHDLSNEPGSHSTA